MEENSKISAAKDEKLIEKNDIVNTDVDELLTDFKKQQSKQSKRSQLKKLIFILGSVFILVTIFVAFMIVLKLDGKLFPANLSGMVEDYAQRPVAEAKVCVQSRCVNTDNTGTFKIDDLIYGKYDFAIEAKFFKPYSQEIEIKRGDNQIKIALEAKGVGDISGKLLSDDDLISDDLLIKVGKSELELAEDNSFELRNLTTGEYLLTITSPHYIDISANITINEGSNKLSDIKLMPALDLQFMVDDWLSGDSLKAFTLLINNVEQVIAADEIIKQAKDVAYTSDVELVIKADGYIEKKFQFTDLVQGVNDLGTLNLTPVGKTVYVSERLGYQNIYIANYDGSDEQMLTDNKADAVRPVFINNDTQIAFLSTKDGIKDNYGSLIYLPYVYDVKTGKTNRLGSQGANYLSFDSMLKADVISFYSDGINTEEVWIANINGGNSFKAFEKTNGYITNLVFANNGEFVAISWFSYQNADSNGIYVLNLKNKEQKFYYVSGSNTTNVISFSANRKLLLFSQVEETTKTFDLFLLDNSNGKLSRVTNSSATKIDARFSKSSDYIYYISTRDGKSDLYRIATNGKEETKITQDGEVASFLLHNNEVISYTSKQSLSIINSKGKEPIARKITASVKNDSFAANFDRYYGYWD